MSERKKFYYCYPEPLLHVLQQADVRFHTPQIQQQLQHIERQGLSVPSDILESLRRGQSLHAAVLDVLAAIGDPRAARAALPGEPMRIRTYTAVWLQRWLPLVPQPLIRFSTY